MDGLKHRRPDLGSGTGSFSGSFRGVTFSWSEGPRNFPPAIMAQFVRNLAEKAPVLINGERSVSLPERVNSMTGRPRRPEEDAGCGNPRGLRELGRGWPEGVRTWRQMCGSSAWPSTLLACSLGSQCTLAIVDCGGRDAGGCVLAAITLLRRIRLC